MIAKITKFNLDMQINNKKDLHIFSTMITIATNFIKF